MKSGTGEKEVMGRGGAPLPGPRPRRRWHAVIVVKDVQLQITRYLTSSADGSGRTETGKFGRERRRKIAEPMRC